MLVLAVDFLAEWQCIALRHESLAFLMGNMINYHSTIIVRFRSDQEGVFVNTLCKLGKRAAMLHVANWMPSEDKYLAVPRYPTSLMREAKIANRSLCCLAST